MCGQQWKKLTDLALQNQFFLQGARKSTLFATIPPLVNQVSRFINIIYPAHFVCFTHLIHPEQVEMNIAMQQKNLREYCKEKGIIVTAYSPWEPKGPNKISIMFWTMN